MIDNIINIFEEYQNKHKSKSLLEYDLKNFFTNYKNEILDNYISPYDGNEYDENDMDESYEEGKSDGKSDLKYDLVHFCTTYFSYDTLHDLKLSVDKLYDNEADEDNQKRFKDVIENFIEYYV